MRGRLLIATVLATLIVGVVAPAAGAGGARAQADCSFPVTYTDATGTDVTVAEPPQDVVVLAPSAAQTMWEIGGKEQVVGMPVGPSTAYLEGSSERTNIWNEDGSVNQEKVVGLEPDLVLAANINANETVESLRDAGLTVYRAGFGGSLADIYEKTERLGAMTDNCDGAERTVAEMREEVATVEAAVAGEERPRALYYFFNFTAGQGTFINSLIETAGGQNVAAEAGVKGFRPINQEMVAETNPEWIVYPDTSPLPTGAPYNGTVAYEQNQTLAVDANLISQPAPRVVQPLTKMAKTWHPEAYEAANATATPTAAPTATASPTASPTPTPTPTVATETTDGSGPGFGVVAAVLAGALALLVRRS